MLYLRLRKTNKIKNYNKLIHKLALERQTQLENTVAELLKVKNDLLKSQQASRGGTRGGQGGATAPSLVNPSPPVGENLTICSGEFDNLSRKEMEIEYETFQF